MSMQTICIFGEVLFDHFPDGKRVLGGAPFNVAWHLQAFGQKPRFVSRVGIDNEGQTIIKAMQDWGMDTSCLQCDPRRPTGLVKVSFDSGEPVYDIVQQVAYDAIRSVDIEACDLLYHGTLALRESTSRQALLQLRKSHSGPVFVDVNLRTPWWDRQTVLEMILDADWVKLNSDELALLSPEQSADSPREFLKHFRLQGLVLTRGAEGAAVYLKTGESYQVKPDEDTSLVDTVGAGDAFTAVMILGIVRRWPMDVTMQRAQRFASLIVGQRGATLSDPYYYQTLISEWQITS